MSPTIEAPTRPLPTALPGPRSTSRMKSLPSGPLWRMRCLLMVDVVNLIPTPRVGIEYSPAPMKRQGALRPAELELAGPLETYTGEIGEAEMPMPPPQAVQAVRQMAMAGDEEAAMLAAPLNTKGGKND
jgi:hypothetical protein